MHMCAYTFKTFEIDEYVPILSIVTAPDSPIYKNKEKTIKFTLQIKDIIKNTNIAFYHSFNNSGSYNILNKTNIQVDPYQFEYIIPISSNINAGIYEISIVAIDQYNQISNSVSNLIQVLSNSESRFVDIDKKQQKFKKYIVPFLPHVLTKTPR